MTIGAAATLHRALSNSLAKNNLHHFASIVQLSTSTSFFSYNSRRARRLRKRLRPVVPLESSAKTIKVEEGDTRTVMDILWPNPFKDEEPLDKIVWPKSFSAWRQAITLAWRDYRSTWEGFTTSKGFLVEDQEEIEQQRKDRRESFDSKRDEVLGNVRRNADFLKDEAEEVRTLLRARTGVNSTEDLRKWAADMMRLASDCVNQFMSGYRKGRDDEVEKMLTQYFQELEVDANKPKRRMPKRRVLDRFHPLIR